MNYVLPVAVLGVAVVISLLYLPRRGRGTTSRIGGERPWRRVGAAICLLVAVMFVAGLTELNPQTSPASFLLYWITILALLIWLCGLALKDLLHTRRTIARWRAGEINLDGTPRDSRRRSRSERDES